MKIVLVLLVVAVALWALLGRQSRRGARPGERDEAQAPGAPRAGPQEMIGCAHCGVLFPAGEARRHDGRSYCSQDHLKAGPSGS
ncbi:MAG: PP0621 family protein [Rubrivivax sp.]